MRQEVNVGIIVTASEILLFFFFIYFFFLVLYILLPILGASLKGSCIMTIKGITVLITGNWDIF